ncbi:hypothetical protein LTR96_011016 [Exophiala xenobiotica]|nr:hypothetical protein LTR72_010973 [Exophiala xenobiotica]KAK5263585.1 hypothetical protein LTR96_011016 [Exophiala xenobiotica]KAK5285334.1 hypothetical protein LTR14_011027 [Exophiala xenobiotica]KAK5332945.1 hypothetical protein LTR98_010944 [Exophiala xenobiotica]KAK5400910.1 hypothetical protein LTR06_011125 [Exophiala xenobiotica]
MALTKPGSDREPLLTAHNAYTASEEQHDESSGLSTKHEGTYPDGSWQSWAVVLGSFCSFFSGLGMVNSLGAYQSYIATHQLQHESNTRVGFIFSLHTMLIFSAGLFFDPLFDRDGPRPLAATGAALSLVSYISLGFCTSYWHFLVSIGVIGGLSGALLFTCALSTIPHWFLRRRSLAMSLAISGGSFGGIVFPMILGQFLPKLGLTWTTRVIALTMLPSHIIAILLLKSRFSSPNHETCWPDLSILFIPRTSSVAVALLLVELSLYIPVASVTSFATAQGHPPEVAYRLLTYLSLGSLAGRWLPAFLGDRLGPMNMLPLTLCTCIIALLGFWLPAGPSMPMTITFVLLYGLGSGSYISLTPVCIGQLCETQRYGRYSSTLYMFSSLGSLVGIPIGAYVLESTHNSFQSLAVFVACVCAMALSLLLVARVIFGMHDKSSKVTEE